MKTKKLITIAVIFIIIFVIVLIISILIDNINDNDYKKCCVKENEKLFCECQNVVPKYRIIEFPDYRRKNELSR